jgi:hypothetical protein
VTNSELAFNKARARSEFGDALNANTALAHLLERKGSLEDVIRLTNENFHVVNCGATTFTKWDAEWLFSGGKSENFSIEDLTSSEDLFLRSDVSEDESLRVGSIPLRPVIGNNKLVVTTTTVGLYQIGSGMYEWAGELTDRLIKRYKEINRPLDSENALREFEKNPEWVNDDTLIISRCLRDTGGRAMTSTPVVLVSADNRLGNQLSNTCNVQVIRVDPRAYILWARDVRHDPVKEPDPAVLLSYLDGVKEAALIRYVYIDTGSVNAFLSRICIDEQRGTIMMKVPLGCMLNPKTGKRMYRYNLIETGVPKSLRYVRHTPTLLPRRFRGSGGVLAETRSRRSTMSLASLTSKKSWRQGA